MFVCVCVYVCVSPWFALVNTLSDTKPVLGVFVGGPTGGYKTATSLTRLATSGVDEGFAVCVTLAPENVVCIEQVVCTT